MKKKGKIIIKRIITGVIAICIVCAGGYTRYLVDNTNISVEKTSGEKYKKVSDREKENIKQGGKLLDKINLHYLQNVCTYLPMYESSNELTKEQVEKIYSKAFYYFYSLYRSENPMKEIQGLLTEQIPYYERGIFSFDQFVKRDDDEDIWDFKASTFDDFNKIVDINFEPDTLNIEDVEFDKDANEYIASFHGEKKTTIRCRAVNTNIDPKTGNVNVYMEKENTDEEGNVKLTRENVVIVSADNGSGYKIQKIEKGHPKIEKNIDTIDAEISNGMDHTKEVVSFIKNYQYKKSDINKIIHKLVFKGGSYAEGYITSLMIRVNANDDTASEYGEHKVIRQTVYDACELLGIGKKESNIQIDDGKVFLDEDECIITHADDMKTSNEQLYSIEQYKDKRNNALILSYVSREEKKKGKSGDFLKTKVVLKPDKNIWGYHIDSIKTEEWDDEYSEELSQLEIEEYKKGTGSLQDSLDPNANDSFQERCQTEENIWNNERKSIIEKIGKKYPQKKRKVEKTEKEYWESIIKKIDKEYKINEGDSAEEKKDKMTNEALAKYSYAKDRTYYLVGKYLIGDIKDL